MVNDITLQNDWHVVARSQDLETGKILTVRLLGEDLVLWRSGDQALAWEDRCPHRGASFAQGWVKDNNLFCPYHGFAFNDSGECVHVPAHPNQPPSKLSRGCVKTFHTQERYGMIWVCLGTPQRDLPPLPEWEDTSYRRFFFGPVRYQASGLRAVENFFDFSHIPYVHGGSLTKAERAVMDGDYKVEVHSEGINVSEVNVWQFDIETKQETSVIADYWIFRPLTVCLRSSGSDNHRMAVFFTVTPVDEEESIAWRWIFLNHAHQVPETEINELANVIIYQDVAIVESQRPRRLPLNLESEFHVASDRSSVIYRKWLKQLGVSFGAV
ncbi:MAG: Rieske 2Fe-2S domain-containing protein [Nostoc sp. DedVER02]|uniref:aromatic ring-hydroxylating dioxygenase subunit alpha n=1 Tax=unclassified Nostoc TaxID=2593658 RepID=UPI002AD4F665|nr:MULTISPECIES: aromatic ring-hydroxylating dioxygenase subunit alpha [unclassified Nostoc]MDZ7987701.1 aromatic ring-hydroxylating dioxygenase subunit alpha [Nostoc sp. DedVER02]MDZ8113128.1 aromatic ring-hydroxylating dioxygenase subunit alpha [Nostoc sp. DedVER01b]